MTSDETPGGTDHRDTADTNFLPVPWHATAYVAILTTPRRVAVILGLPFAAAAYVLSVIGLLPGPGIVPPVVHALQGWIAGSLTVYILLWRPY